MAYRCPVCDAPQVDAEHLANHLAFTAVIRGDEHEDWLDEHVPGWDGESPETLAPKVDEAVPEVEVPEFDEAHGEHGHGGRLEDELAQGGGHRGPGAGGDAPAGGRGDLTDEAAGVMEEARELTERMYGLDEDGSEDGAESDGDDASGDDAASESE